MSYEELINDIAREAYDNFKVGNPYLFQIGRIPDIEFLDYGMVIGQIREVFTDLMADDYLYGEDFDDFDDFDGFESENK